MQYRYADELSQCAGRFIEALAQAGIEGAILPGSMREYSVKLAIRRGGHACGPAVLYYSPKKNRFSIKTHELKDKSVAPDLQACWASLSAPGTKSPADGPPPSRYHIYVDGSCLDEDVGYGLVVLKDGQVVEELWGPVEEEAAQGMRQVAGELRAAREAMAWCQTHDVEEVSLFYDYEGIEKWATGAWRAHKPATQAYARAAQDWPLVVHWQKVESHTGDRWNEHADQLAKRGAMQHRPGQGELAGEEQPDPLSEARDKAAGFVEFLSQRDIAASFEGLVNDQLARVVIGSQRGYVDVYNTRKRPVSDPYLHGFRDTSLQERVASLWQTFFFGGGENSEKDDAMGRATYYYEKLKPYRDCDFDFVDLATALQGACEQAGCARIDSEAVRFDFEQLEAIYHKLQGGKTS